MRSQRKYIERKKIKVVDVGEVIKQQKIHYNESLLSIEYGEPKFSYWLVNRNTFKKINDAHYKRLISILKD